MESRGAKGGQSAGTCLAVRGQRCGIRAVTVCRAERHGEGGTWPKTVSNLPELYVAVDVEADGPIPGPYSMISLGMAVAGRPDLTFYTELRPISDDFVPQALAVSGLDRDRLLRSAAPRDSPTTSPSFKESGSRRPSRLSWSAPCSGRPCRRKLRRSAGGVSGSRCSWT